MLAAGRRGGGSARGTDMGVEEDADLEAIEMPAERERGRERQSEDRGSKGDRGGAGGIMSPLRSAPEDHGRGQGGGHGGAVAGVRSAPPAPAASMEDRGGRGRAEDGAAGGRGRDGGQWEDGRGMGRGPVGDEEEDDDRAAGAGRGGAGASSGAGAGGPDGGGAGAGAGGDVPMRGWPKVRVVGTRALDLSQAGRQALLTTPCPPEAGILQCYIERSGGGFFSNVKYSMYMKSGDEFLMAAEKRSGQRTSNFTISSDPSDLDRHGKHFLGKVRSNWVGTEYMVYDEGAAPGSGEKGERRKELAIVTYESNVMGARGPRKMKAVLPEVGYPSLKPRPFQPREGEEAMLDLYKKGHLEGMQQLMNKPPKWSEDVGAYVLNFNGRVTMASVKNFQLVSPDELETVIVQFGRVGKDLFTLDFRFPLSPLQAFGIALSSFDYKLACE